jgi:hypothetical protein
LPLASLSPENQINAILGRISCAAINFSPQGSRLSHTRIVNALSGQNDFNPEDGQYYLQLAREMERLENEAGVPVDWKRIEKVRQALDRRRQKDQALTRPEPHYILYLSNGQMFERVENGEVLKTDDLRRVKGLDNSIVFAVQELLRKMGFKSNPLLVTNYKRDIATTVQEFGFELESTVESVTAELAAAGVEVET